jgi:cell division protein FtsB
MADFKKRNYKFWHSPLALVLLFLILVYFAYRIVDLVKKERETANEKELILNRINDLQTRKTSLDSGIAKLETQEGKEEIIRDKYQVAKDGEKMVIIVDDNKSSSTGTQAEVVNHGFWNWIKKVFKF